MCQKSTQVLTRETLIEKIQEIEFWPELLDDLNFYLRSYLDRKDLEVIRLLLSIGANPNPDDDLDCYLTHLLYEYRSNKTLHGDLILSIMELLLVAGADANRVWCNNYRAYDYAVYWNLQPIAKLLEKYGANKKLRDYI